MNWEEFLKPTLAKTILFLLVPVFYTQTAVVMCFTGPCPQPHSFLPLIVAVFIYIKNPYLLLNSFIVNTQIVLFRMVVGAVVSYLVSCSIVFLYKKTRINWKEFFRPTRGKFLLFVFAFLLPFFVSLVLTKCMPSGLSIALGQIFPLLLLMSLLTPKIADIFLYTIINCTENVFHLSSVFILLAIGWYVFSCVLVYLYEKYRK